MIKIAIVSTHPIQYNAPWFKLLAEQAGIQVKVFYTWSQSKEGAKYDHGFKRVIEWDIPLLDGYEYEFVDNVAKDPGSHHFKGINNPTLNKEIEAWRPNAIIVIGWSFKSHLSCMRYFKGRVPVLFRGDSTLLDEQPGIKRNIRRVFLKYVYSFIDYALYVGTNNKNYFLKHGLKPSQLWYAPHAIDNGRFANAIDAEERVDEWRNSLGIKKEDFVVLFAGKLEPKKDPHFFLQLAYGIKEENIRFVLVGNGPLEEELKKTAANDSRIIFLDFQNQNNMPLVYRLGNVFVLPSQGPGETWGLAINEAMACGRAVVASDKTGCAIDLIKPKQNGHIIKDKNLQDTVSFIKAMIANRNIEKEMGKASQEIIKSFSFEEIVTKTVALAKKIKPEADSTLIPIIHPHTKEKVKGS